MPKVSSPQERKGTRSLSDEDLREIALEAYVYAYPLVLMEVTRRVSTNVAVPGNGRAPMNQFGHMRAFPDPRFTDVVAPNVDTLYSILWFDVSEEPLVIRKPDSGGRYHLLPMLDMWTDVFASPGSRTTGDGAQTFAIVGPTWFGSLPGGVTALRSPTEHGWIIGRVQTDGKGDYADVHAFQAELTSVPLDYHGKSHEWPTHEVDAGIPMTPPVEQVARMDAATFFKLFTQTARRNSPHAQDHPVLARMRRVGLVPGSVFEIGQLSPSARSAFEAAPEAAMKEISTQALRVGRAVNGWRFMAQPIGVYGADYLHRASVAYNGLGANVAEDAVYPAMTTDDAGKPLDSGARYTLHFDRSQLPPVRAFWSLTLYNERHFLAENPIDRCALGDRDTPALNADGSRDLYIQRVDPGRDKRANWLPTPQNGAFSLVMRLYWPKPGVTNGEWTPPALRRLDGGTGS